MINSFHIIPWLYLSVYPISAIIFFIILNIKGLTSSMPLICISIFILILLLLVYLYINNIIGLFDLIALTLICCIYLFFLNVFTRDDNYVVVLGILGLLAPITLFIYSLN